MRLIGVGGRAHNRGKSDNGGDVSPLSDQFLPVSKEWAQRALTTPEQRGQISRGEYECLRK